MSASIGTFLRRSLPELIGVWVRLERTASRDTSVPEHVLVNCLPELLQLIAEELERGGAGDSVALKRCAERHAEQRFSMGFPLERVVLEYGRLRRVLVRAAFSEGLVVSPHEWEALHVALDFAVAGAVATYLQRSTEALETERHRFDLALRRSRICVFEQDRDLRYTWVHNPQLGGNADDLLGRTDAELMSSPEDVEHLDAIKRRVLETGASLTVEVRCTVGASVGFYLLAMEPKRDARGHVIGLLGATTDISAAKREEVELRRALEFRERVMGIVSHDLRNPLNAILLAAELLLMKSDRDARERRTIGRIVNSADLAARMIRDLLDYTRAHLGGGIPIERRPARMDEIGQQALDEVSAAFPDRRFFFDRYDGADLGGEWDRDRIAQVLMNLLRNAVQHSVADTPVNMHVGANLDDVFVEVHNTGEPIPQSIVPLLFEAFKQGRASTSREGSVGLGLYIASEIVRGHGGRIEVDSRQGHGTSFRVLLPRKG